MAAVAAVGSSLSTSLKFLRSKTWSSDSLPRIAPTRVSLQVGFVSQINATVAFPASPKWRVPRISADVAQEEAAAAVEEAEEVGGGEAEAEAGQEATNNPISTKLYFGNLPYLCDSAQLAGIIQQYASPELVEVLYDRDTGRSRGFAFVTMSTIEDCNAVIQNLDGLTSESLAQAFQQHGNVVGARVLYDGETGRSRGYGFMLEGRAMRVSLAQGKRQ
ncbi:hypothetical protein Acr_08g0014870 [Actinidia rufa]|uniref:RRM domain-containing protein n=1 Tax=Actinidia rufa TaxID=165716 RepID=A0A7J0F318_9ERIC|nr:hypothetical protein Acr_08g0014870 [Actinidia rufa]